jgi:hypothetical protein
MELLRRSVFLLALAIAISACTSPRPATTRDDVINKGPSIGFCDLLLQSEVEAAFGEPAKPGIPLIDSGCYYGSERETYTEADKLSSPTKVVVLKVISIDAAGEFVRTQQDFPGSTSVDGIGDAASTLEGISGAFVVLKGNHLLLILLSDSQNPDGANQKAQTLAQEALPRLPFLVETI